MDEHLHRTPSQVSGPLDHTEADGADPRATARRSLRRVDFNLLLPLQALLAEANVTRAAERANVGQPAMSASLAKLRRHFENPLLTRDGRGMKLTPFAVSLLDVVNQAVDSMQQAMGHHAAFDPGTLRRTFTVITSDYVTIVLIKPLLQSIVDVAPGVTLNVVPPGPQMLSTLRRGETDLVVAPPEMLPPDAASYPNRTLFTDRIVLVAGEDNTAVGENVSLSALAGLPFVEAAPGLGLPEEGLNTTSRISTGSFGASMHLVAGTSMVTLAQNRLFEAFGVQCGLRAISLKEQLSSTEAMYWHSSHTADPAHMWLRAKLRDVAASL